MTTTTARKTRYIREYRFQAPLTSKLEDELLLAVRHNHNDAEECRQELINRGWKPEWIK